MDGGNWLATVHGVAKSRIQLSGFTFFLPRTYTEGFFGGSVVKNLPANAGDLGSIPRSGRSPGGGNGNQYSCLGNPMDRGAHGVTKSWLWLSDWNTHRNHMGRWMGDQGCFHWFVCIASFRFQLTISSDKNIFIFLLQGGQIFLKWKSHDQLLDRKEDGREPFLLQFLNCLALKIINMPKWQYFRVACCEPLQHFKDNL